MRLRIPFRAGAMVVASYAWLLIGCQQSEPPHPDHPRVAAGVAMRDITFFSVALGRQMPYRVFLPAKMASGEKLPVVYLLHGGGGDFRDWSNYSDVSAYAARGLILVMPEGGNSYYLNAVGSPRDKYEDYLVHDLIADVGAKFPVKTGRESQAIVGVSMGGFAAVKLALSEPGLFVFAGAISPAIDVPERKFSWKHADQWSRFRSIFGPMDSKERATRDPFLLARSADPGVAPYLYLTAGEKEALLEPNRRFAELLKRRGFAHEFHTKPGGHDWGEWDAQIPGCFTSLLSRMPASPSH